MSVEWDISVFKSSKAEYSWIILFPLSISDETFEIVCKRHLSEVEKTSCFVLMVNFVLFFQIQNVFFP